MELEKKRILVIEDDPADRKLIKNYLNSGTLYKYEIRKPENDNEIESELLKEDIDVILLDLHLSGKRSGMDWLEYIIERQVAPAIVVTGYGNEHTAVELMKMGAYDYISKTNLSTLSMEHAISQTLEKKQLENEHKQAQEALKEFSRKILSIREEEKKNLAISLHDEVGSMAVSMSSSLAVAKKKIEDGDFKSGLERIRETETALEKAVENLKNIAVGLRPMNLDIIGLPGALREYFSDITGKTKIRIDFDAAIGERKIGDRAAIVLYRVAQEALVNSIKHAGSKKVKVRLYVEGDNIKLYISDDGKGFDTERTLQKTRGLGLLGMSESVKFLSGIFTVSSVPKKGTAISVTIPDVKEQKS